MAPPRALTLWFLRLLRRIEYAMYEDDMSKIRTLAVHVSFPFLTILTFFSKFWEKWEAHKSNLSLKYYALAVKTMSLTSGILHVEGF